MAYKAGIDEDWSRSCLEYPASLDYFFSLIEISLPTTQAAPDSTDESTKGSIKLGDAVGDKFRFQEGRHKPIYFTNAVGRKFNFPWARCKTWKGMETLIEQTFKEMEGDESHVIRDQVHKRLYDLLSIHGHIILPEMWESAVRPGEKISMHLWPVPKEAKPTPIDPHAAPEHATFASVGRSRPTVIQSTDGRDPRKVRPETRRAGRSDYFS